MKLLIGFISFFLLFPVFSQEADKQAKLKKQISRLENYQDDLETRLKKAEHSLDRRITEIEEETIIPFVFLSAVFSALWAQNTQRSSWLWFFFGLLLAPIALITLLIKNGNQIRNSRFR